jgi:hypothetical protein
MKKVPQIKKWVDIVLRLLIVGAFVLFIVLIMAGVLIFEIFDKPMSSLKQSLREFLTVVGAITVVCLAYIGVRRLLESIGVITKKPPYWLPAWEEDWVTILLPFGAVILLVALLAWIAL